MNEELKIIIKAVTDEAKKNLAAVKEELNDIETESQKAGKTIDTAMKNIGKGVAVAVGAITALTTAMVTLTKNSMEFQKSYAKLISGFQASGSTVKQATETYKNLFRFLGEADTATEASNLLVKLTNDQENLAEWTTILQGVYATFPDSLPVEALAEAANETARTGVVTGNLADALNWAGVSEDAMNAKLATTNSLSEREAILRGTLNSLYGGAAALYERNNQAMLAYNESQVKLDIALANATRYVIPLMTQLNNLAATLLQVLKPAFETISAVVIVFVQWIVAAIQYIGSFFGLFGEEGVAATEAVNNNIQQIQSSTAGLTSGVSGLGDSFNQAADAAKELKKQTMGFDELNIVSSQTSTSTGGSTGGSAGGSGGGGGVSGGGISIPSIGETDLEVPGMDDFQEKVESIKKTMETLLPLIGLIAAGLVLWKIVDFAFSFKNLLEDVKDLRLMLNMAEESFMEPEVVENLRNSFIDSKKELDTMKSKLKTFGGLILIVAGAVLLVKGYLDAWVNGVDWGNFTMILAGVGLIIGGIALAFGPLAAVIATIVGGITLLVIGIKDLITNGYSMQAVILVAVGAILVLVGAIWAFNSALLANPITWIVVAIMALVAAFVILWNECEGFRNFWIAVWEKAKVLFAAFVESIKPLINAIVGAFKEAWELIKVIWNTYLVPLFKAAWEAIKAVWNAVKPYFTMVWNNIKAIFSVVKTILGAFFKAAWDAIKIVWNQVVSYFTAIWNTIKGIFSVVKNVLSGNWKGAWDAIKGIVNTWKDYFSNTWNNIKKIFSVVATFFKSVFKAAWDGIKAIFGNVKTFFSGIWSGIKGAFGSVATWFKDTFKKAWEGVKNVFSTGGKIFSGLKDGIAGVFKTVVNGIIGGINKVIAVPFNAINGMLNKIRNTSFLGISPFSKLWGQNPLAVPQIPKLATGGIVTSATTALIGEAGREAVLPLENNTGWMDILADRIASRNNTPSRLVLMLDGKELGYATINSINDITKQTGKLQLAF